MERVAHIMLMVGLFIMCLILGFFSIPPLFIEIERSLMSSVDHAFNVQQLIPLPIFVMSIASMLFNRKLHVALPTRVSKVSEETLDEIDDAGSRVAARPSLFLWVCNILFGLIVTSFALIWGYLKAYGTAVASVPSITMNVILLLIGAGIIYFHFYLLKRRQQMR